MKKHLLTFLFVCTFLGLCAQTNEQISIDLNKITVEANGEFVSLSYSDAKLMDEVGAPQLPVILKTFVIPVDAEVTGVKINSSSKQKLPGNFYIYPAQPPIPLNGIGDSGPFHLNELLYKSLQVYPENKVQILRDEFELGYHIVTVGIYPIEYIPGERKVNVCDINFSIEYNTNLHRKTNVTGEEPMQSLKRNRMVKRHIKSVVENSNDVDKFSPIVKFITQGKNIISEKVSIRSTQPIAVLDTVIPEYIIITNEDLKAEFQKLADWKIKKGIPTIITTTEYIFANYQGMDKPEKIRNYLKEVRSKWDTGLFVLLGGCTDIVPERRVLGTGGKLWPTDLYYATTGESWFDSYNGGFTPSTNGHDFYLGRAPVRNTEEARVFTEKVISYEKSDKNEIEYRNYYNNFLIACGMLDKGNCEGISPNKQIRYTSGGKGYIDYFNIIKESKNSIFPNRVKDLSVLMFDNYDCSNNIYAYDTKTTFCTYKNSSGNYISVPVSNLQNCISGDIELNNKNFVSALNNGNVIGRNYFHFIYHIDHSSIYTLGTSSKDKSESFDRNDADKLQNGKYYQIMYSGGCDPATFSFDCLGARYLNNPDGGAVAFIGNSDVGLYMEIPDFKNFIKAVYDDERYDLGYIFRNTPLTVASGKRRLTLLGDPTMEVWTDTPKDFNAEAKVSASSTPGKISVDVTIRNLESGTDATICLRKGTEAYMVDDNISANGTYSYEITSHSTDSIDVTITAHNYVPKEISLVDPVSHDKNVWVSELDFDDVTSAKVIGNGNGLLDAGETVGLSIKLKNTGLNTASSVKATLRCNIPQYVSLIDSVAQFGNITGGEAKASSQKYHFKIDANTPQIQKNDLNPLVFTLKIEDGTGKVFYESFGVDVFASDVRLRNKEISFTSNGNQIIEAGETVRMKIHLFNAGKTPLRGVTALLTSTSPYIQSISRSSSAFPEIKYQETQSSVDEFEFKLTSQYVANGDLIFNLKVSDASGKVSTFSFNLLDRPQKINVNNISNVGYKNDIELKWSATNTATIEGYNVYRSNADANGNDLNDYKKLNTFLIPNTYFKDYGLEEFTTYYYKITAVSKNSGNESEKSEAKSASTVVPLKYIYPITLEANLGKEIFTPMICYDVDNDGYKEIFTAVMNTSGHSERAGTIVGFNYDGSEFFKRGNETTNNGFADIGVEVWSELAIGDLYGTGENQIVSATRDYDGANNYITCHSLKDEDPKDSNPDVLWQKRYDGGTFFMHSPIIRNVDQSPDGSMEVILSSDHGNLFGFENDGKQFWDDDAGVGGWSYPSVAVANVNGYGYDEIIWATKNGVFIRCHDGTTRFFEYDDEYQPLYFNQDYTNYGSVVVADIYNNNRKQIVFKASNNDEARVYVVDGDNKNIIGQWDSSPTIMKSIENISVGDLDGDGLLEIVTFAKFSNSSNYHLVILDSYGELLLKKDLKETSFEYVATPILADVDGDNEAEIIFCFHNRLEAIKLNGTSALGFPINVSNEQKFPNIPCIADIDNDGKNEIVAATKTDLGECRIYVWETKGNSNRIEWGSSRHNAQNTNEYHKVCTPTVIGSNTAWSGVKNICGNIIIESGTLTLENDCTLKMDGASTIIVKSGASLVVDGGMIENAAVRGLAGSSIFLINDANVKTGSRKEFNIMKGCSFINEYGVISR